MDAVHPPAESRADRGRWDPPMFPRFLHFRPLALLTPLVLLAAVGPADAGWMVFRNDTSATLVIQERGRHSDMPKKVFAKAPVPDSPTPGAKRPLTMSDHATPA